MREFTKEQLAPFKDYLFKRNSNYNRNTIKAHINTIYQVLSWAEDQGINPEELQYNDLVEHIRYATEKGNKKITINRILGSLRFWFNYQIEAGKRKDNPAEDLHIRGVQRRLPHDILEMKELEEMYKSYNPAGVRGKRNKVMLSLIIWQAVRPGELEKLELSHVNLEEGTIYIPCISRSASRVLKLEAHQMIQLQQYMMKTREVIVAMTDKKSDQLFVSIGKGSRIHNTLHNLFADLKKQFPKLKNKEQIRASIITHWLSQYNIREVQYRIGHKYVSSTEVYRTDTLEDLQSQIDELHPLK